MYVYIQSGLWTVGFYDPDGEWQAESDHDTKDEAANRVHYLNGGKNKPQYEKCAEILGDMVDVAEVTGSAYLYRRDLGPIKEILAQAKAGDPHEPIGRT